MPVDTLAGLICGIDEFARDCEAENYTDMSQAWVLLHHIRETLVMMSASDKEASD